MCCCFLLYVPPLLSLSLCLCRNQHRTRFISLEHYIAMNQIHFIPFDSAEYIHRNSIKRIVIHTNGGVKAPSNDNKCNLHSRKYIIFHQSQFCKGSRWHQLAALAPISHHFLLLLFCCWLSSEGVSRRFFPFLTIFFLFHVHMVFLACVR